MEGSRQVGEKISEWGMHPGPGRGRDVLAPGSAIALTALLLAGCSHQAVGPPPPPPVDWYALSTSGAASAPQNAPTAWERDMADAYVTALASPGLAQLGARLHPNAEGSFSGSQAVHGRDQVVSLHELVFGAFDQRTVIATCVLRTAAAQAIEWTMTGTQIRDWMGVPPTHRPVAFKGVTLLWTHDDGTIVDAHIYFDVAVVKAELGAGPKELVSPPISRDTAPRVRLAQTGSPVEMSNVATMRASLDAVEAKDEAAYLASMTDDVEIYTLERGDPMRGRAGAGAYYAAMDHAIGQLDTSIAHVWGIERFVVVEYSIAGIQLGPVGWVPVMRDRVLGLHIVDVAELRDGRIARIWRYDNPQEIAADNRDAAITAQSLRRRT
jgi:ketosteroid isomerase-like protein